MDNDLQVWLTQLQQAAQVNFEERDTIRDQVLRKSRELIRICSSAIRAGHREQWDEAHAQLAQANAVGKEMQAMVAPYPDLVYAGYVQDALKELVEARLTLALLLGGPYPDLETLDIPYATYLNGVCEAASELRRRCLNVMRRGEMKEAERLLNTMDAIYEMLMGFGYPDAISGGLRRRVDQLRGVLERTRGDLTNSLQMYRLWQALQTQQQETNPMEEHLAYE